MRPIQLLKTKFLIVFHCIYDVIRLHQVSGSSKYDDVMTKQVPGVSGANLVGRHLPSVPNKRILLNCPTSLSPRSVSMSLSLIRREVAV